jgi:hypothetical protein
MKRFTPTSLITGAALMTIGALLMTGCPEGADLKDPTRFEGMGPCDAKPVFESACGGGICHGPAEAGEVLTGTVDLISPGVEERLLNQPAQYLNVEEDPEACPTDSPELYIDTSDINRSLLLTKLTGGHACGARMPLGPFPLDDSDINCIREWTQSVIDAAAMSGTGGVAATGGASATGGATATGGDAATGGAAATGGTGGTAQDVTGGTGGTGGSTGGTGGSTGGTGGSTGGTGGAL